MHRPGIMFQPYKAYNLSFPGALPTTCQQAIGHTVIGLLLSLTWVCSGLCSSQCPKHVLSPHTDRRQRSAFETPIPKTLAASANPLPAFNHAQSSSAEAEYDRLRALARAENGKKQSCFDRAHQAYERGDGAEAHELSEEGKRHARLADQYNKQASEYIFRENNAVGRVDGDTIDLHGQFVEEAEDILEQRIRYAQSTGQTHLHVYGVHFVLLLRWSRHHLLMVSCDAGLWGSGTTATTTSKSSNRASSKCAAS